MNTGQILNGLGGMLAQSVGPFISNTWFPPDERTTATAIATLASQCGLALSYVVGPSIVTEPKDMSLQTNMTSEKIKVKLFDELSVFMFLELIITVVLLAVAVVYFPNKPKLPPSNSASLSKLNFKDGFKQLLGKKSFWLILFIAASTTGIYSGWNAVLYLNLSTHNLNISQVSLSSFLVFSHGTNKCLFLATKTGYEIWVRVSVYVRSRMLITGLNLAYS